MQNEDYVAFGNIYLQEHPVHPKEWLAIELIVLCNISYPTHVPLLYQYRRRYGLDWFQQDHRGKIRRANKLGGV